MATILQLETATQVCSAAISVNGETVALKEQMASNIHAGSLTLFIKEVMDLAGLQFADLDAVAVSKGPGSYTGLRIGVSTAKGLCFALEKPLIAIDTLQMMAAGFLAQLILALGGGPNGAEGAGECGAEAISARLDDGPIIVRDGITNDGVMSGQCAAIPFWLGVEQAGAAFDVREQEGNGASRQGGHRNITA